ncbi:hypothetical protein GUJ93_ZPchr0008g12601 [Zizania palustris]|uniref:Uncharacterized protein n=1 Tax=Zizania palustris TaxID=103762 RepID=A0A8J5RI70_ZIZPA|nr:hypothetical protein GUJ93_ZPchr0008g12601 [Zizania palustris]
MKKRGEIGIEDESEGWRGDGGDAVVGLRRRCGGRVTAVMRREGYGGGGPTTTSHPSPTFGTTVTIRAAGVGVLG